MDMECVLVELETSAAYLGSEPKWGLARPSLTSAKSQQMPDFRNKGPQVRSLFAAVRNLLPLGRGTLSLHRVGLGIAAHPRCRLLGL